MGCRSDQMGIKYKKRHHLGVSFFVPGDEHPVGGLPGPFHISDTELTPSNIAATIIAVDNKLSTAVEPPSIIVRYMMQPMLINITKVPTVLFSSPSRILHRTCLQNPLFKNAIQHS